MYASKYEIRYSDYKDYETVKPSTVLEIIQELAIKDAEQCGHSVEVLRGMGLAWLLKGFNVHFEKPISTHVPIEGFTAIKNIKASTSERGSIIKQSGKTVAKTVANWFMFDVEKQRPVRIPAEMAAAYEIYDFNDNFFTYRKPKVAEGAEQKYAVRVSNRDIDTNCHLNNEKSAEIIMDAVPFAFFFTDFRIIYKKQVYLGEMLDVFVKKTENGYYVCLKNGDGDICVEATLEDNSGQKNGM